MRAPAMVAYLGLGLLGVGVTAMSPESADARLLRPFVDLQGCVSCDECGWFTTKHETTGSFGSKKGPPHECIPGACANHINCGDEVPQDDALMQTTEHSNDEISILMRRAVNGDRESLRSLIDRHRRQAYLDSTNSVLQLVACGGGVIGQIPLDPSMISLAQHLLTE